MKRIIQVVQDDPNLMHFTWIINNICTNKCSYCPKDLHTGANHNYHLDNARKFLNFMFDKYPKVHCSIAGGEPSVSPFLPELVKMFYDRGHTVGLTSNAAKPVSYWENLSPYLNYISFSYHPEFADTKFYDKVKAASEHTAVVARVMMHPKYWNHCIETYSKLLEIKTINVEVVRIIDWGGGSDSNASQYSEEQIKWFEKNGLEGVDRQEFTDHIRNKNFQMVNIGARFKWNTGEFNSSQSIVGLINQGYTNFYGYECEIGLKSLFIDQYGLVFLGNCALGGPIGSINDPQNIRWPRRSVICTKRLCHCTTDVAINKQEL